MRLRYLREHRPVVRGRHVLSGILPKRRFETGSTRNQRMEMPVPAVARRKGVTGALKAAARMAWVDRMNGAHSRAEEIILRDLDGISVAVQFSF